MTNLSLGVVGCGVVGGTLANWLEKHGHEVLKDDPGKGFKDDLSQCKAIFVCVPVPTNTDGKQDVRILKQVLKKYQHCHNTPFFIRSTLIPKTTDHLRKFLKLRLHAMPEFLTERESAETMDRQSIICGIHNFPKKPESDVMKIVHEIFKNQKEIIFMSNREAELAKIMHNVYGAMKVNLSNTGAKYAEKIGADWWRVLTGILESGYINSEHTMVPGPDKKYGFGGKCFPKDMVAFLAEIKRIGIQHASIEATLYENFTYRVFWKEDCPKANLTYPKTFKWKWEDTQ